jgi:hypothetical protein
MDDDEAGDDVTDDVAGGESSLGDVVGGFVSGLPWRGVSTFIGMREESFISPEAASGNMGRGMRSCRGITVPGGMNSGCIPGLCMGCMKLPCPSGIP